MRMTRAAVCFSIGLLAIHSPAAAKEASHMATCAGWEATQVGTVGRDVLRGGDGIDVLVGLGGNDVLLGFNGDDRLCGGPGDDVLRGYWDNDVMFGGPGDDFLGGGGWGDGLRGGPGNDFLKGGGRLNWICPDIAYFAPDGGPIHVNKATRTISGQGVDTYLDLDGIYGTFADDVVLGSPTRPHFHEIPRNEKREEYMAFLRRISPIPPNSPAAVSLRSVDVVPLPTFPTQEQITRGSS